MVLLQFMMNGVPNIVLEVQMILTSALFQSVTVHPMYSLTEHVLVLVTFRLMIGVDSTVLMTTKLALMNYVLAFSTM